MLLDFKKLMTARFLFTFAVEMQAILLGWRMWELTHDPLYLAMIGLSEAFPAIGLALYAGYFVDRGRPLIVLRGVIAGSFLSGLILLVSQLPAANFSASSQVAALFCASFVTGAARSFSQPSMYAIVPRIVERHELPRASAWMTTALQFARILGPAAGGFIVGRLGMVASGTVVCAVLLGALSSVLLIRRVIEPFQASDQSPSRMNELLSGAAFVFRHPILLPALSLDMFSVLFAGVSGLLPVYATDILNAGSDGFGYLRTASAVGAALVSFALARWGIRKHAGALLFSAVTGFGVCILIFAVSRNYYLSLAMLGLSGAFDSVSVIVRSTAVQLVSPDALRGRISAVNSIFIGSSNEIGEVESGIAAKLLGTVPSVLFGGVMCLLTVLGVALFCPALRTLDLGKLENEKREA